MANEIYLDPSDQYQMQNVPGLNQPLGLDPNADAGGNARRPALPPSELIVGPGKPYRVSVAYAEADPKKQWRVHTHSSKTGLPHKVPFFGCNLQYTVQDSPGGQYDGWTITDYVMTMVNERNKICSVMGVLQAMRAYRGEQSGKQLIDALMGLIPRMPVIGVHVDWTGQRITERPVLSKDGINPEIGPNGQPLTENHYEDVQGMDSWRSFFVMAQDGNKIPPSRIERKNPDGSQTRDQFGPIIYIAKAQVIRREALEGSAPVSVGMPGASPFAQQAPMQGGFGAPPPAQYGGDQNPFVMGAPPHAPAPPPPQQQYAPPPPAAAYPQYAPPQQQQAPPSYPPQQQQQYPPQAPPPVQQFQQQQAPPPPQQFAQPQAPPPYQAPQPAAAWNANEPPPWVTGR